MRLFAGFPILDHAEKIFRTFYAEAPPDTARARWLPGQPLQVSGLLELRHSARTNIGAWEKSLHPGFTQQRYFLLHLHVLRRRIPSQEQPRHRRRSRAHGVLPVASWCGVLPQRCLCQPYRSGARRHHRGVCLVRQDRDWQPRWRCSVCGKTFSQNTKATARQREHHKN